MQMSPGESYAQSNQPAPMEQQAESEQQAAPAEGQDNPVLEAFETIAAVTASMEEQQNPAAAQIKDALASLVAAFQQATGGEGQMEQPPAPGAQAPGGGGGMNPMVGNAQAVPQNGGQVPVI